ncbi:MAG: DUF1080 domain-containing protein [Acidobacteriota bacterium]|nr:DUF1080 domain-containing protein [Acidobacteriota bacterium]
MRTFIALTLLALSLQTPAQNTSANAPFVGRWNMTGTGTDSGVVYWLEVKQEGETVTGRFLNRFSSPYDLPNIKIENGELVFSNAQREGQPPPPVWRGKIAGGKLVGTTTIARRDPAAPPAVINWVGVRPPTWPASNANGRHTYGKPVSLFDGTTMKGWGVQHKANPMNWSVAGGAMVNAEKGGNNLVSEQTFGDFKIEAEYKLAEPKPNPSNSGIYLRGRYELQVFDDAGKPSDAQGHMAIYGRTPASVNASKKAGEWQTMEAIVVGNRVTVMLNGKKVHDNAIIDGITGGALDANELAPGPIMLQGDHGVVSYRKVVVTPILKAGS